MLFRERIGNDTFLKEKIKAIRGFPDLKIKDWMPVAMSHYHLKEKLPTSDKRYWKVFDFCKNARKRRDKKRSASQLHELEVS